ncbi:hypothetical protein MM239_02020 [Belliella sp. DSM 111904]|uniref:Uncharacterized protein n=1 Tax=Belliella filtrata TaxID=2923435 RepID=A0ABS9UVF7_9BACT|nr:hypothetical protein [Belliella filtrata]MCH7408157.1 hypothetical protein [Belliella filtrata]
MMELNGFYDDDGNKIDPLTIKKPCLCLLCKHDEESDKVENILCNMTRYDQRNEANFECGAFEKAR